MKLLTLNEAAERLAISLSTMRAWVSQRRIEVVKIGRCVRIREEALEAFICNRHSPCSNTDPLRSER